MKKYEHLTVGRLKDGLKMVRDPRRQWGNLRHQLVDIFIIALFGIISGCESWEDVEDYGKTKEKWLRGFLVLEHGVPSADTCRRLFELMVPTELERVYREWVTPYVGGCLQKQISFDGKTVRGATKKRGNDDKLHIVSAWVREDGITIGQIKTNEKSNEITAIPELLKTLDVSGGTVTIDAMGCQTAIAEAIVAKEANYVLAVKMNQPTLCQETTDYFTWATEDEIEKKKLDRFELTEKGHGRICTWTVTATSDVQWFESIGDWPLLKTMIMVNRKTIVGDIITEETQYYISSLIAAAEHFHRLIRGHWSIESQLHWVLDVTFHEDQSLIHKGNSPENLSTLKKIALALLKKGSSRKASLKRKRKIAGWDNSFLESLFGADE